MVNHSKPQEAEMERSTRVDNLKIKVQEIQQLLDEVSEQLDAYLGLPSIDQINLDQLNGDLAQVEHHAKNSVNSCYAD